MKIVVDTNRIIAALIKNSYSRTLLLSNKFEFYTCEAIRRDIAKYKEELLDKSKITEEEFDYLLSFLLRKVKVVSFEEYKEELKNLENIISDKDDIEFLALANVINADGVWSDDNHFQEQNKIRIFKSKEMVELIKD